MPRKMPVSLPTRMLRQVRIAETEARTDNGQDTGTGFTILKLRRHQPPLATLTENKKIGATELQAAAEIELAAFSVGMGGRLTGINLQRLGSGRENDAPWPYRIAEAVRNYQSWQKHWTRQRTLTGSPMLEVVWSAVIDERPIAVIAQEIGYGRYLTGRAIVSGLRHYAAWTRMVTGPQANIWLGEAQHVFDRRLSWPRATG